MIPQQNPPLPGNTVQLRIIPEKADPGPAPPPAAAPADAGPEFPVGAKRRSLTHAECPQAPPTERVSFYHENVRNYLYFCQRDGRVYVRIVGKHLDMAGGVEAVRRSLRGKLHKFAVAMNSRFYPRPQDTVSECTFALAEDFFACDAVASAPALANLGPVLAAAVDRNNALRKHGLIPTRATDETASCAPQAKAQPQAAPALPPPLLPDALRARVQERLAARAATTAEAAALRARVAELEEALARANADALAASDRAARSEADAATAWQSCHAYRDALASLQSLVVEAALMDDEGKAEALDELAESLTGKGAAGA